MAFINIKGVEIKGFSCCTPIKDEDFGLSYAQEISTKTSEKTGIYQLRKSKSSVTAADLCYQSTRQLLTDLNWDCSTIECLVFVTQTPDYILPSNSCILQGRLGLNKECYVIDISLGCSGWIYALSVISSIMSSSHFRRGLILAGDTISKICSPDDKSTYPLFGDAGTATALELNPSSSGFKFHLASDGLGYESIIVRDGGSRSPANERSFVRSNISEGISRSPIDLELDGMNVFSFAISKAPESISLLCEHFEIDKEKIDAFVFHQANLFMNETIRRKLKLPLEKVPYSLKNFGNTSCASIPLTLVTECRDKLIAQKQQIITCGFGVGLSWGSCYFETDQIVCSDLIEV